jgi:hypothetical protein
MSLIRLMILAFCMCFIIIGYIFSVEKCLSLILLHFHISKWRNTTTNTIQVMGLKGIVLQNETLCAEYVFFSSRWCLSLVCGCNSMIKNGIWLCFNCVFSSLNMNSVFPGTYFGVIRLDDETFASEQPYDQLQYTLAIIGFSIYFAVVAFGILQFILIGIHWNDYKVKPKRKLIFISIVVGFNLCTFRYEFSVHITH